MSFFGIQFPEQFRDGRWSGAFLHWIETIPMENSAGKTALTFYLHELNHDRQKIAFLNRESRNLAKDQRFKEKVDLLKTVHGIGTLTAMIFLLELVDMNRFKNLGKLASFIGLVPGEHSSGDDDDINNTEKSSLFSFHTH